jgi:hypothetical protein
MVALMPHLSTAMSRGSMPGRIVPARWARSISCSKISLSRLRSSFKPTLIAGLLLIAGGLLWFSRVRAPGGSYAADVLGPSLLAAVGLGLAFVPVTIPP